LEDSGNDDWGGSAEKKIRGRGWVKEVLIKNDW
jgi:hypothetical protein